MDTASNQTRLGALRMEKCPECNENSLRHLHDTAHGIPGTHMKGSERFECKCGFYCSDYKEGEKLGLDFFLDKE